MKNGRRLRLALMCLRAAIPVIAQLSICSLAAVAQAGQDAVWNASNQATNSPAFIDASMFLGSGPNTGVDLCDIIYGVLSHRITTSSYTSVGAVIDTRALSGSALNCTKGSPWSENNVYVPQPSPATILLPAGTIVNSIGLTWQLPPGTHVVGQGESNPTIVAPGTTIQAASGFMGPMIQFGNSTLCPSACTDISLEKLTLDGQDQNGNVIGIDNAFGGNQTWVDHVVIYQVTKTGLWVRNLANDSGPYSNITFSPHYSTNVPTSMHCADINASNTRGIHGLTCESPNADANSGILLDSSNNLIEDVRIIGFYDGILVGENGDARSNVLRNIFGDTDYDGPPHPIHVIHIANNGHTVSDLAIIGLANAYSGSGEFTIEDDLTLSQPLPDSSIAMYVLGANDTSNSGGYSRYTTSPNVANWASGSGAPIGGCTVNTAQNVNNVGSLFSNTSTSGAALWVCSAQNGGTWLAVPVK